MELDVLSEEDRAALTAVGALLERMSPMGVALSGGVDSSVLLAVAAHHLGPSSVLALIGVSASLAEDERRSAHTVAEHVGVRVVEVMTREVEDPQYRANGPDRCFHCRDELFSRIDDEIVAQHGLSAVAYGENADDAMRTDRPGAAAAVKHGVISPLRDAGIGKDQVRRLARWFGLPNADRPAAPCLASRIPYFEAVIPEKLRQIELAESGLRELGFRELRVRHHGPTARVELPHEDRERATLPDVNAAMRRVILGAGFERMLVDAEGVRSGAFFLKVLESGRE